MNLILTALVTIGALLAYGAFLCLLSLFAPPDSEGR